MDSGTFKFPVCWKDDVRMGALFSEFRPKDANPEGWQDKMDFWVSLILQWSKDTETPVFSAFDLASAFERKRCQPACLQTVLAYMARNGDLVSAREYFATDGWVKWGFEVLVRKPLSWVWNWSAGGEPLTGLSEELLNVEVLKDLQKKVLETCREQKFVEDVVSYSEVWNVCRNVCRTEKTFVYVLRGLEKAKLLKVFLRDDKKVVQFVSGTVVLSEQERALRKLERAKADLNAKVESLQQEAEKLTAEAVAAQKQGQRNKALYALKKRRRLQAVLDKQFAMLDNIHSLEVNLENEKDVKLIYDGYKSAAGALKATHLDVDDVDDVISDVRDVLEDQEELGRIVSSVFVGTDPELDELEEELSRVLETPEETEYPEVPEEEPSTPEKTKAAEVEAEKVAALTG